MSVDFNKLEHEIKAEISIRKRNSKDWWIRHNLWVNRHLGVTGVKTIKCDVCGEYVYRALLVNGQWACSPACFGKVNVLTLENDKVSEYLDELIKVSEENE